MSARLLSFAMVSMMAFVACTGGGGPVGGGGSSSGGSSSGSTSSSSGSGSSSGGTATACTELVIGGTNDPALGGSAVSQVIAQTVSDFAASTTKEIVDLTTACKDLAIALDASASNQAAADGQTEPRAKMDAWCKLAVNALGTAKATAGGTTSVQFDLPKCPLSVQEKAACQGRCAGAGPCDTTANPMVCTGGELSGGFCTGGELEGGCAVDAKCDQSCDTAVVVKASCPTPDVVVTSAGASDPTTAAKLEAALEAQLPAILALLAHCKIEANVASGFAGVVTTVSDIKEACLPPLINAVSNAGQDLNACLQATASVVGSVQ